MCCGKEHSKVSYSGGYISVLYVGGQQCAVVRNIAKIRIVDAISVCCMNEDRSVLCEGGYIYSRNI